MTNHNSNISIVTI